MSRPHRKVVIGVGLAAAAIAVGVLLWSLDSYRSGGALVPVVEFSVDFPLAAGEAGTWGMVLPTNGSTAAIHIESVEAIDPVGLEVIGIATSDPDVDGGIGTAHGFPPDGIYPGRVAGSTIPPAGGPSRHLQILIGVLRGGPERGSIAGLRIRYIHDGARYEDVLPWSLNVFEPSS